MEVIEDYAGQYHFGGQLMVVMETYEKNNQERSKELKVMELCNQQNRKSISYMGKGLIRS